MRTPFAALVLVAAAAAARAESIDAAAAALGWQTEHAAEIAIVTATSETGDAAGAALEATLRVEETLRGTLTARATVVVEFASHGRAAPWRTGGRYLAFLVPAGGSAPAAPRFHLVSGSFGLRPLPDAGPETRFPGIVREIAATLATDGTVRDAAALRTILVRLAVDAEPGVSWSGATDLVRHRELHEGLSAEDRAGLVAAYRRCPVAKATKGALAFAVAAAGGEGAVDALVETLVAPGAKPARGLVAEALRRLADPRTEALLDAALARPDAEVRKNVLVALGACGGAASVPAARRALADDAPFVRAEAAHALGQIARNVRLADAEARVEGTSDLDHTAANAKTDDERVAALWALAQLDRQDAWDVLRRVAADPEAPETARKAAERYLKTPRVSLLLE